MTYNIDPAGVQIVLSRVTDAGVILSTALSSTANVAEPLAAGLKSPLEPVANALVQFFDREQSEVSDITNSVTAGLNAAVATSLAYFSGDDEMAANAVRAAQQAAIDGNFDYFVTGDGRLVPPSASEAAPAESYSESYSESYASSDSDATAAAAASGGVPQASFGMSGGVESSVASFGAAQADEQSSAHLEPTASPRPQLTEVSTGLQSSATFTQAGSAAGAVDASTPAMPDDRTQSAPPAAPAGPLAASPVTADLTIPASPAQLEPSATAGHRFAEVSSVQFVEGVGAASGDGIQERASEIFRLIRPGRRPAGGGDV